MQSSTQYQSDTIRLDVPSKDPSSESRHGHPPTPTALARNVESYWIVEAVSGTFIAL